jgi:hypothetical protein
VLTALAERDAWPGIRARAAEFIDNERSWAHSVARYSEVYHRIPRPKKAGSDLERRCKIR